MGVTGYFAGLFISIKTSLCRAPETIDTQSLQAAFGVAKSLSNPVVRDFNWICRRIQANVLTVNLTVRIFSAICLGN